MGSIYSIDQYNALEMGLHSLRQHISIIPQAPFIFKGTIRQNLDPFEAASDDQIEQVVSDSGLSLCIQSVRIQLFSSPIDSKLTSQPTPKHFPWAKNS